VFIVALHELTPAFLDSVPLAGVNITVSDEEVQ
jgi:hypothetical protein